MKSIIIDKDRDTTSGPLIICRKRMEGRVISDGNGICVFKMCFLKTKSSRLIILKEQQCFFIVGF